MIPETYIPLVAFIVLGVLLAKYWIVTPLPWVTRLRPGYRIHLFILACWLGTFVVSGIAAFFWKSKLA